MSFLGIDRPLGNDQALVFRDHGRYLSLMCDDGLASKYASALNDDSSSFVESAKYPSLVSFVGQTGGGKSTLIRLIIQLQSNEVAGQHKSPVVGSIGQDLPTSEDVHLYLDPISSTSRHPILFADCEGFDGGEREPLATTLRKEREAKPKYRGSRLSNIFSSEDREARPKSRSSPLLNTRSSQDEREILWAKSPEQRTRHFAVSCFYPRLLFTFSDVVVFVHRNAR